MATSLTANTLKCLSRSNRNVCVQFVRCRYKPPDRDEEVLPTHEERIKALKLSQRGKCNEGINIGAHFQSSFNKQAHLERLRKWQKERHALEKAARHQQLQVDLDQVKGEWTVESSPLHIHNIAKHYGIFADMFDGAHFHNTVPLHVAFDYDEEFVTPVYFGNAVPAHEASLPPYVSFPSHSKDDLWTLVMSSPDGNLESNDKELLHWMVCNIPQGNLEQGDTVCEYMPPFPVRGAGYLRYVFILYKQVSPINPKEVISISNRWSLRDRTFSSLDFYGMRQDNLTPAGLAFFQSEWDKSVRAFFHDALDMQEPAFEFIHPPPYIPEQLAYPHKEPFDLYMDRYRDKKDIQEEVLKHKLKNADPLSPPQRRAKYANTDLLDPKDYPSWLRLKIQRQRLGQEQWKALYEEPKH